MKQSTGEKPKILTIPNILSLLRICMIPFIVYIYCVEENYTLAGYMIILSGITDALDGFIARHFNLISDLGKILDPIADKLTQIVILACLFTKFRLMIIPIVCMVIKETLVGITGLIAIKRSGKVHGADWHGKIATILLYGMLLLHMFWYNIPDIISNILIVICTIMIGISCILYGVYNIKVIRTNKK